MRKNRAKTRRERGLYPSEQEVSTSAQSCQPAGESVLMPHESCLTRLLKPLYSELGGRRAVRGRPPSVLFGRAPLGAHSVAVTALSAFCSPAHQRGGMPVL